MSPTRSDEFTAIALGALPALYNAAYRLTGSEHDANDLVQDTYLEAFRHAGQLRNLAHCKAWLFRILRNRHVSIGRSRRARPELVLVEGGLEADERAAVGRVVPLDCAVIARLARPAIVQALARLPEEMRTAVLLCDLEGFTYAEIAEIVECPIGTVRSRIARARAELVRQLAGQAAGLGIGSEEQS